MWRESIVHTGNIPSSGTLLRPLNSNLQQPCYFSPGPQSNFASVPQSAPLPVPAILVRAQLVHLNLDSQHTLLVLPPTPALLIHLISDLQHLLLFYLCLLIKSAIAPSLVLQHSLPSAIPVLGSPHTALTISALFKPLRLAGQAY